MVEPLGRRAEAVSGTQRLEESPATVTMKARQAEQSSHCTDGGLRASRGAAR